MRIFAVGDIHGAYLALKQVLEKVEFDVTKDKLVVLGDVCDGYTDTYEVIEYLMHLRSINPDNIITIMGNHDKWFYDWLKTNSLIFAAPQMWFNQGGKNTFNSYVRNGVMDSAGYVLYDEVVRKHLTYFKQCLLFHIEDNMGFVHGGFTSPKGLGHEASESNYYWDRELIQTARARMIHEQVGVETMNKDLVAWFKAATGAHSKIFIGHTCTQFLRQGDEPFKVFNIIDLDTGAGHGERLTLMNVETEEYVQSDRVAELYPNVLNPRG